MLDEFVEWLKAARAKSDISWDLVTRSKFYTVNFYVAESTV